MDSRIGLLAVLLILWAPFAAASGASLAGISSDYDYFVCDSLAFSQNNDAYADFFIVEGPQNLDALAANFNKKNVGNIRVTCLVTQTKTMAASDFESLYYNTTVGGPMSVAELAGYLAGKYPLVFGSLKITGMDIFLTGKDQVYGFTNGSCANTLYKVGLNCNNTTHSLSGFPYYDSAIKTNFIALPAEDPSQKPVTFVQVSAGSIDFGS
ncbi:MAG: hypothetical protein HY917_03655, partial [Candidatus Diapherotrites archaeon]|nr:hypothetical protein [Candidatus Diapherotrites archaeon]